MNRGQWRFEQKERVHWHCELCGADGLPGDSRLVVHHIDGNKENLDQSNMIVLCRRCHYHFRRLYIPGQKVLPRFSPPPWMIERGLGQSD